MKKTMPANGHLTGYNFVKPYLALDGQKPARGGRDKSPKGRGKWVDLLDSAIHDSLKNEAAFTMVVFWSESMLKVMPTVTKIDGEDAMRFVRTIPLE
jgi:hypothetical protein